MSADLTAVFFEEAGELLRELEGVMLQLESAPGDRGLVDRLFRAAHTLKGTSAVFGFERLSTVTHEVEDAIEELRSHGAALDTPAVDALLEASDLLNALVVEAGGGSEVPASEVDACLARLRSMGAAPAPAAPLPRQASLCFAAPEGRSGGDALSVRVPLEKLEGLVNLAGELAIAHAALAQQVSGLPPGPLVDQVELLGRRCRELQERVLAVRMLPVKGLFSRLQRLVRDTAAGLSKRVELLLSGEEVELDRTILERLSDPLTHLLRNALDHGIEPPAERRAAGKPEAGRITVSAAQRAGGVLIEVADDGRGLDRARILARARERGLVPPDRTPSEAEVDQLLFLPGFTTAERVTEVSGRGVGLDVVARNVEALHGSITLASAAGRGTRIAIRLPLTLAILDGLLLSVGGRVYVAPLAAVVECLHPRSTRTGAELPLLALHELFGHGRAQVDPGRAVLVVLDDGCERFAVPVDELLGHAQVVVKSLETHLGRVRGLSGAAVLGDGSVALILDPAGVSALWRERVGAGAAA